MTQYQLINLSLLLTHGLVSVALIGAVTHQCAAVLFPSTDKTGGTFISRYRQVKGAGFARAVALLYISNLILGGILYPEYRLEVRYALEEMHLLSTVGLFELKEHWAAIGLALLPLYLSAWHTEPATHQPVSHQKAATLTLGFIIWFTFLTGHVVNNVRGL